MENLEKTALIKLWDSNYANYARGWGICFVSWTQGPEFCTKKLCLGQGFCQKKIVAWGEWQLVKFIPDVNLTAE